MVKFIEEGNKGGGGGGPGKGERMERTCLGLGL